MKLIVLKARVFSINKYLIYFVILFFLLKPFVKRSWYALTYHKTKGLVKYFDVHEFYSTSGTGRYSKYYPVVEFSVDSNIYTCRGSSFQKDVVNIGTEVPVLYDLKNANNAYVYTFLAFWGPDVAYLIPVIIFFTLAFLGLDSIPKYLTLKI